MKRISTASLACLLLLLSLAAYPATSYTRPDLFAQAVADWGLSFVLGFDAQSSGSEAAEFGMLRIGAQGLASDGSTQLKLGVVAANDYSTTSAPNSLGASGSENQFLAGNGDMIGFRLSRPVHAFGVSLIGNPSPTGRTALPFWRMRVFTDSGYEAYSDTRPLETLGRGNDVYFLGVVSPDEPFSRVELYSDNDLAAVYSFSIDDVAVAADVRTLAPGELKHAEDGPFVVDNLIATRAHPDRFNVESLDRTTGLAVMGTGVPRGDAVKMFGEMEENSDGERVMRLVHLISQYGSNITPAPLSIGTRALGGSDFGLQKGFADSPGLNNIGLDVVVVGRVTGVGADWITVDDGAGRDSGMGTTGVKVTGSISAWTRQVGDMLRVCGSSSMYGSVSGYRPLVRVASYQDIHKYSE